MADNPIVAALLVRLRELREEAGLTPEQLDERLILGPGWVTRFESAHTVPTLDVLVVLLDALGRGLGDLVDGLDFAEVPDEPTAAMARDLHAEQAGDDLDVRFRYADHDASYRLRGATLDQFDHVVKTLRDGLARLVSVGEEAEQSVKADSVARTFLAAARTWPHANPSDLWWFLVMRAYNDAFNHPARYARLDLGQSWRRTGGWALEEVLVRHYAPALAEDGIRLFIAYGDEKAALLSQLEVADRLESDKVDVLLTGREGSEELCFGVVHVKASFAERRTDDVPLSKALVEAGYTSPLWTMDCKSLPSAQPRNKGELGAAFADDGTPDRRSAKRKDIEEDGYFSACFSYNANTIPTPNGQDARARIQVCDFTNPTGDAFATFVRDEWARFRRDFLA